MTVAAEKPQSTSMPPLSTIVQLPLLRRFHVRVSTLYGAVVCVVLAMMGGTFYVLGVRAQMQGLQSRLRTAAITLANQVRPETVLALNVEADSAKPEYRELTDLFKAVGRDEPQFVSIYVFRPTNREHTLVFAADYVRAGGVPPAKVGEEYDSRQAARIMEGFAGPTVEDELTIDKWGPVLSGYAPIRGADGKTVGIIGVDISANDVAKLKSDVRLITLMALGVALVSIVVLTWLVGRNVRRPLGRITDATTQIAAGRLDTRVGIDRNDEFGILGRHLDAMTAGLAEREIIRATFGRYVSEDVARRILSSQEGAALGGEERIVTVLFSDLANYSTLSEKLAPADVVRMLNAYFGCMGEIIDRHHGCVIEFLGDAILCVFGAPDALPDHAERAVRCAIAMQQKLSQVNDEWADPAREKEWQGQGATRLQMRIGVHTGPVIAGNIGSESRVKYAIIGDSVNVASRVEQLNKDLNTEILITEETMMRVPDALRRQTESRGDHRIKGRSHTVTVHTPKTVTFPAARS